MYNKVEFDVARAFPGNQPGFQATKAGNNGTLIAVILDESGSMNSCREQTISGFNEFIQTQQKATDAGVAYLTLVKFNAPDIRVLYENMPVAEVSPLTSSHYTPSGMTNLYDAIGNTISRINGFLEQHPIEERPGVLVVIMTDGYENSSREYTSNETIKNMVKVSEEADWTYQFLGANVDAFSMGATLGMNSQNTAAYSTASMKATMSVVSESAVGIRAAKLHGISTKDIYAQAIYSEEDRARMMGAKK
jgi:hypothetical protein